MAPEPAALGAECLPPTSTLNFVLIAVLQYIRRNVMWLIPDFRYWDHSANCAVIGHTERSCDHRKIWPWCIEESRSKPCCGICAISISTIEMIGWYSHRFPWKCEKFCRLHTTCWFLMYHNLFLYMSGVRHSQRCFNVLLAGVGCQMNYPFLLF